MSASDEIQKRLPTGEQLLLLGVTGSTAYGLAHAGSDEDRLGIYAVATDRVLGFGFDVGKASHVWTEPEDVQLHEIGKYLTLVLKGNPTVSELLFLSEHEHVDPRIEDLVAERHRLLGATSIRSAYVGYSVAQAKRLQNRKAEGREGFNSDLAKRTAKHGRHCFRLLLQAEQLLSTGSLTVDVSDRRDEILAIGELAETDVDAFTAKFEEMKTRVDAMPSVLPNEPDRSWAEAWLINFRRARLN